MPRPRKNNADYFSHDAGMRNDEKILALRNKYGHLGYSTWNMILETLTNSENFEIKVKTETELEILAGDFRTEPNELQNILSFSVKIGLLDVKNHFYTSKNLKKRLQPVLDDRARKRDWASKRWEKQDNTVVIDKKKELKTSKTMQSKVKESKVYTAPKGASIKFTKKGKEETYSLKDLKQ